jgi:hypothetical protein
MSGAGEIRSPSVLKKNPECTRQRRAEWTVAFVCGPVRNEEREDGGTAASQDRQLNKHT